MVVPLPGIESAEEGRKGREVMRTGLGAKYELSSDIQVIISRRQYTHVGVGLRHVVLLGDRGSFESSRVNGS